MGSNCFTHQQYEEDEYNKLKESYVHYAQGVNLEVYVGDIKVDRPESSENK